MSDDFDGLRDRALNQSTNRTKLLDKLATFTDEEWDELTHRLTKHFDRELVRRGLVLAPVTPTSEPDPGS